VQLQTPPDAYLVWLAAHGRWLELHAVLQKENRAGITKTSGRPSCEVMLVPLAARDGAAGSAEPVFAGFVANLLSGDFARQVCHCQQNFAALCLRRVQHPPPVLSALPCAAP
jgi:hypothetical protein